MHITINDIAEKAGVSMATVSRVINELPHVSEKSRQKVQRAINELNYIPNAYARGLSKNSSNILGVMVPEIANPFFSEIITGITETADKENLNTLLFNTDESTEKEKRSIRVLQEYRVCGLVITPVTGINEYDKDCISLFESLKIPIVLMDRNIMNSNFDGVYFDDRAALYKATSLLLEEGHKNIVMITGSPHHIITQRRVEGYRDAFKAHGVPVDETKLPTGEFTIESAYKITKNFITNNMLPTAFIGMTNMLSMGCLKAIHESGISIPKDVAFVGYDRLEMIEILNMKLTLVEKDAVEMGRTAAALLIDKLNGTRTPNSTILMPELFVRGSEKYVKATT
jgi:LacI family transcriptional regulator